MIILSPSKKIGCIIVLVYTLFQFTPILLVGCESNQSLNNVASNQNSSSPVEVLTGVRLINVEKVDPSSNLYTLDFYIWFIWDENETTPSDVASFEFLNGVPQITQTSEEGYPGWLQYRVRGNFIKNLDIRNYPFDSYVLPVTIEHLYMNSSKLVYVPDPDSSIDKGINFVGWEFSNFKTYSQDHKLTEETFSDYNFSIQVTRPFLNSFIKYVLPVFVITLISLLTFFIKPAQFSQRITITVTTLISASATHLSILNGLPPTAYLTIADRIYLAVYSIFLFNLAVTVYLMRLVEQSELKKASAFNDRAFKVLIILVCALLAIQFFL